jgi:hypothetical protein
MISFSFCLSKLDFIVKDELEQREKLLYIKKYTIYIHIYF